MRKASITAEQPRLTIAFESNGFSVLDTKGVLMWTNVFSEAYWYVCGIADALHTKTEDVHITKLASKFAATTQYGRNLVARLTTV